jgi:hypothetical protein
MKSDANKLIDLNLWEDFQVKFKEWTPDHFTKLGRQVKPILRKFLCCEGVYIQSYRTGSNTATIGAYLYDAAYRTKFHE